MKYWTEAWSLVEGCTYVSPGCANCWSAAGTHRRAKQKNPKMQARYGGLTDARGRWTGEIRLMEDDLHKPFSWRKPRVVAIWNDLLHEAVPDEFLARAYNTMSVLPRHTFLVFTKRPERAAAFLQRCRPWEGWIALNGVPIKGYGGKFVPLGNASDWPFPNIYYIISAENQEWLDRRLRAAMNLPGPVALNLEPLLGPVDLRSWLRPVPGCEHVTPEDGCCGHPDASTPECHRHVYCPETAAYRGIKGVLCGGESGRGARVMQAEWAWAVRDQCVATDTPFYFKQWGEYYPTREYRDGKTFMGRRWRGMNLGRALGGVTWDELPWAGALP